MTRFFRVPSKVRTGNIVIIGVVAAIGPGTRDLAQRTRSRILDEPIGSLAAALGELPGPFWGLLSSDEAFRLYITDAQIMTTAAETVSNGLQVCSHETFGTPK
jgi:hypothetical protein